MRLVYVGYVGYVYFCETFSRDLVQLKSLAKGYIPYIPYIEKELLSK